MWCSRVLLHEATLATPLPRVTSRFSKERVVSPWILTYSDRRCITSTSKEFTETPEVVPRRDVPATFPLNLTFETALFSALRYALYPFSGYPELPHLTSVPKMIEVSGGLSIIAGVRGR